jgi:plastocyanin
MRRGILVLVSTAVVVLAIGWPAPAAPGPCDPADKPVNIVSSSDSGFSPMTVEVPAGGTVCWTNQDVQAHTATADNGGNPNSGTLNPGGTYRESFPADATIPYHCAIHANMKGTVKVGAGSPPGGGGGGTPGGGGHTGPGVDARPRLSNVRVIPARVCTSRSRTCPRPGARLRFSLSEAARVRGTLERLRSNVSRVARRFSFRGVRGVNRVRLPVRGLRRGRYRVTVRAVDPAGNRSTLVRTTFRIVR